MSELKFILTKWSWKDSELTKAFFRTIFSNFSLYTSLTINSLTFKIKISELPNNQDIKNQPLHHGVVGAKIKVIVHKMLNIDLFSLHPLLLIFQD